ncbi:MAG: DEAD/DEAH box helicase [Deltaproteobacteria bacterium]|nr:DEAD/DEAH box helicase [Deltaproteobacteria bacterium]
MRHVTSWQEIPPREGSFAALPEFISPLLVAALQRQGITELYSHQREALDLIHEGKSVVIVTPTASGKTLCYNVPVLQRVLENSASRSLYLFPTKALAHDQLDEARSLIQSLGGKITVATYDGDTPMGSRSSIRKEANIVISNPDMLHTAILPNHTKWAKLFANLDFVVIDELHIYRGIFGSHVANVLERLARICRFYGAQPQFILCSATVANPQEHAENILRRAVELVCRNGAPAPAKTVVLYNPPILDYDMGIRQNALTPARKIASLLIDGGMQTITFATSRLNVEILTKYLRDRRGSANEQIAGYRGGYLPQKRREIEAGIRSRRILGVVSTNALELGIDIGDLDACVICGYPGSIASTWQQAGRAGRKKSQSLAVIIARANPLDQFMIENPDYFFSASPEHCRINPNNILILLDHIKCAAFEIPFAVGEKFGDNEVSEILEYLEEEGVLHCCANLWHWSSEGYPAENIGLRRVGARKIMVIDTTEGQHRVIAEVDWTSALASVHDGAIYICEGQSYFIDTLATSEGKAYAHRVEHDYFTESLSQTTICVNTVEKKSFLINTLVCMGEVLVRKRIIGYKKLKFYTMENLGYGELDMPSAEVRTTSYWCTIAVEPLSNLPFSQGEIIGGLSGVAYAMRHMAAVMLMAEINDIAVVIGDVEGRWFLNQGLRGRITTTVEGEGAIRREDMEPTIFIFDNYPGGIGFSEMLFNGHDELLRRVRMVVENCPCRYGCPSCVGPADGRESVAKEVALRIIGMLKEQGS